MVKIHSKGNFDKTEKFLINLSKGPNERTLDKYGEAGVKALMHNTPVDSGKTAESWRYEITHEENKTTITWCNDNVVNNGRYSVNVAILLQYGHGTKNGGFVQGIDIVNPALAPVFDKLAKDVWEEMTNV